MLCSAINFAFNEAYKTAFQHFGLPEWFKIECQKQKENEFYKRIMNVLIPHFFEFMYKFNLLRRAAKTSCESLQESKLLTLI